MQKIKYKSKKLKNSRNPTKVEIKVNNLQTIFKILFTKLFLCLTSTQKSFNNFTLCRVKSFIQKKKNNINYYLLDF